CAGMGGAPLPRVYGLEAAKLLPSVGFSGRTHLPTTMRAQAPAPMPKEYHDAFLQPTAPILLRRRFACQDDVPVRLQPRRPEAVAQGSAQRSGRLARGTGALPRRPGRRLRMNVLMVLAPRPP